MREHLADFSGSEVIAQRFDCTGVFDLPDYLAFVADRAAWLDLGGWVAPHGDGVTVFAVGAEAMVGALEMACLLGPLSCLVSDIAVTAINADDLPQRFEVKVEGG